MPERTSRIDAKAVVSEKITTDKNCITMIAEVIASPPPDANAPSRLQPAIETEWPPAVLPGSANGSNSQTTAPCDKSQRGQQKSNMGQDACNVDIGDPERPVAYHGDCID